MSLAIVLIHKRQNRKITLSTCKVVEFFQSDLFFKDLDNSFSFIFIYILLLL